jgi:hypothetical protein
MSSIPSLHQTSWLTSQPHSLPQRGRAGERANSKPYPIKHATSQPNPLSREVTMVPEAKRSGRENSKPTQPPVHCTRLLPFPCGVFPRGKGPAAGAGAVPAVDGGHHA